MNKFDCLIHEMLLTGELTPLSMSSRTHFMIKQNYLRDIAYLIKQYVNLELTVSILLHLNLKMLSRCHGNVVFSYCKLFVFEYDLRNLCLWRGILAIFLQLKMLYMVICFEQKGKQQEKLIYTKEKQSFS